jgi:NADH:ubiquinone oxidoreductase subunit
MIYIYMITRRWLKESSVHIPARWHLWIQKIVDVEVLTHAIKLNKNNHAVVKTHSTIQTEEHSTSRYMAVIIKLALMTK